MVATRGRTFKRPWRRSCHSSKLKSSSAPIGRKDSWRFHAVGSSNAPLLGSTAAEGLQRIGRTSTATRWRSCGLPQSASCSENFVIPPDVFGQTLSVASSAYDPKRTWAGSKSRSAAVSAGVWCEAEARGRGLSSIQNNNSIYPKDDASAGGLACGRSKGASSADSHSLRIRRRPDVRHEAALFLNKQSEK